MPMKELKTETSAVLTIERILHVGRYSLSLNKNMCKGCGMCVEICPKEAMEIKMVPKTGGKKAEPPVIDVIAEKCHYCGMCDLICPFGALMVKVNGEHLIPVAKTESFPNLLREIKIDTTDCALDCVDCEEACPLELIKVNVQTSDGKKVKVMETQQNPNGLVVSLDIDENSCPCCGLCETKCPEGAIRVRKMIKGNLSINHEKCPEGCQDCLDVCPIPEVLHLSKDGKVYFNKVHCVYCGVCKLVCPEEEALAFKRSYIRHTSIHSGAWNKALEKLTSTKDMTKELKAKSSAKVQESVRKRFAMGGKDE